MTILFYLILIALLIYWIEGPLQAFPNLLNNRRNAGEELENWLKKFNWGNRQTLEIPGKLPSYKFYTEVVEVLLSLARKMGGNYQESLLYLREGLQVDRQFEKKLKEAILGTWLQMGMMMVLTWTFIVSALSLVDVKISTISLVLIFFWQLLGLCLLPVFIKWLRAIYFGDIGKIWKMLYVLKSLARVPLSRTEIFTLASITELDSIHQKSLSSIVAKLKETCQKAMKIGGNYDGEVQYLMEELRFLEKWHFELFDKKLIMLKLALLSIFFLPSYLAFIFLLLGDLMAIM